MIHSFGPKNCSVFQYTPIKVPVYLSHQLTNSPIKITGGKDYPTWVGGRRRTDQ